MVAPIVKQTWAVTGVLLNMLGQGMMFSYPSCLLPALRHPDSPIQVDLSTASWLASSVGLSSMLGFFVSSFMMECYGRRLSYALVIFPAVIGWVLIYLAQDATNIMIGRILCGITAGATVTLGAIVIGEFTCPTHRGMFLNLKTAAVCLGNTVMHILSNYYNWRTVAIMSVVPFFFAFANICTWPESPAWLASKRQYDKSEQAFFWLRGKSSKSRDEYEQMIRAQKKRTQQKLTLNEKTQDFFRKFVRKDFVKPVIIIFFGALLLEACGRHTFPAYASIIIEGISGDQSQSFYYTICIDLITTASASFSSVLIKMMKRRTLLFSTGLASLFVLFTICSYLFLVSKNVISKENTWIPLTLLVVYFILANLGCTPIPFAFLGEVFPLAHKGAGAAVSGVTLALFLMIALKITPYLLNSFNFHGTFAVFGAAMAGALLVLYFILPETKDRTLLEIEDYFNCGRYRTEKERIEDEELKMKMVR